MITTARLWRPWLRVNRILRVIMQMRSSAEAWAQVRVQFRRELALRRSSWRRGSLIPPSRNVSTESAPFSRSCESGSDERRFTAKQACPPGSVLEQCMRALHTDLSGSDTCPAAVPSRRQGRRLSHPRVQGRRACPPSQPCKQGQSQVDTPHDGLGVDTAGVRVTFPPTLKRGSSRMTRR